MDIYNKDKIKISTIEEADKDKVLEYFSENSFNCDYESGALRPTNSQFIEIMNDIISGKNDENNILVLKKNNEVIGYESMFVEFDRLIIGHIAIKKSERKNGYGELLTKMAILIAENENRDVTLYCNYPNRYFEKLKLKSKDGIHYIYKRQGIKTKGLPKMFVSVEDYKKREEQKRKSDLERFIKILEQSKEMGLEI